MRKIGLAAGVAAFLTLCGCEVSIGNMADAGGADNAASNQAAPAARTAFVNSRAKAVSPELQENYIDFSFSYPSTWGVTPQRSDGTERNFVRVAAPLDRGYEPFAVHVGYVGGSGNTEGDRQAMIEGTPGFAQQFGSNFSNYQVVSVGPSRIGRHDAYGWRFTADGPGIQSGPPARIYGRGDFILQPGATAGITIISLVTDRSNEARDAAQVGESGTLREVLDSFTVGGAPEAGGGE